jgi:hypothetical protein
MVDPLFIGRARMARLQLENHYVANSLRFTAADLVESDKELPRA